MKTRRSAYDRVFSRIPRVLSSAHVDPEVYSGFAFGVGAERIAMVKFGISDIRHFWRPNLAYLEQF